ncbi:MAG: TonB family protein [Acidobacteriota bacterium]
MRGILATLVLLLPLTVVLAQEMPAGTPYRVGGEVTRPEKVSGDGPQYSELARRARVTGVVIVEAVIDEQGNVTDTRVLKGLPMGLDRMAVDALKTWKFKPATFRGKAVPVYYTLTINFQLGMELSFGSRFGEFLQQHPDFAETVEAKRYGDALALLDRWSAERPQDQELRLARTYVLMADHHMDEAWDEIRAYDGPDTVELAYFFAVNAQNQAWDTLDSTERYDLVELGLQSIDKALALRPDDPGALSIKSTLLRRKASGMSDDDPDAQAVRDEADRLEGQAGQRTKKPGFLGGMTFPEKVSGDQTELTGMARKAGISGTITIEAVIDEQGNVVDAKVVEGLPMGLDEKALETVRTWKFKPATSGGKPIRVNYTVTVSLR